MPNSESLHFRTHAELKNVIGQDLINDDSIAIVELVKNGLDAGATDIRVNFVASDGAQYIVITDNGNGMSKADITNKWLNIAYSEKKNLLGDGRQLAGNKGVGRFACDRLGAHLDMYTCTKNGKIQHLEVDWSLFEGKVDLNDEIQSVNVELTRLTDTQYLARTKRKSVLQSGTELVISELRANWDREKILSLKRSLERFVDPNTAFDKMSVSIQIVAKHFKNEDAKHEPHLSVNGRIENQILERLKFKTTYLTSEISSDSNKIVTALYHDGQQVYRVTEKNESFEYLPGTSVVVHYMNPYKKAYFKRQTGLNTVEFGSIFLFLNGYRIPPYGDRDNDWLKLDNRKGQGTSRYLGNRELLGRIVIRDNSQRFRVVSNREGVARSLAFTQLTDQQNGYFYSCLKRLERFVVSGLDWDSVTEDTQQALTAGKLPGDGKTPLVELYRESNDSKRRRIALNLLKLIGASRDSTLELEIDPAILATLSSEREEEVHAILQKFGDFDGVVDKSCNPLSPRSCRNLSGRKLLWPRRRKSRNLLRKS
jgi:Histidine kinase-, DNA gyrase B-, and HSP90-like ATPase